MTYGWAIGLLCVILIGVGHELWRINETLKRIADILTDMAEDREKREQ